MGHVTCDKHVHERVHVHVHVHEHVHVHVHEHSSMKMQHEHPHEHAIACRMSMSSPCTVQSILDEIIERTKILRGEKNVRHGCVHAHADA